MDSSQYMCTNAAVISNVNHDLLCKKNVDIHWAPIPYGRWLHDITKENEQTSSEVPHPTIDCKLLSEENKIKKERFQKQVKDILDNIVTPSGIIETLLPGLDIPGDCNVSMDARPEWLDMEKFRRGQKFAMDYYFSVLYAEMLSLFLLFSWKADLDPLIYTGQSDTPFKAFKRYLSTALRVKSWYTGDIWTNGDEAWQNIKTVRNMHSTVQRRMQEASEEDMIRRTTVQEPLWANTYGLVQKAVASACPFSHCIPSPSDRVLYVTQAEMSVTQFGFIGLIVLFPDRFGAGRASEEELEGFVHLWRGIGFLLGIEDRFNFCAGDLNAVRQRCRDVIDFWFRPVLKYAPPEWEHMVRCMVAGVAMYIPTPSFETSLAYLCDMIELPIPEVKKRMTFVQKYRYYMTHFLLRFVFRLCPWLMPRANRLVHRATERALFAPPQWLQMRRERVYSYQRGDISS